MTEGDTTEAHSTVSRFRKDLREAEKGGSVPTYLIDRAGTLVADVERLGGDNRLINDAKRFLAEAMALLQRR